MDPRDPAAPGRARSATSCVTTTSSSAAASCGSASWRCRAGACSSSTSPTDRSTAGFGIAPAEVRHRGGGDRRRDPRPRTGDRRCAARPPRRASPRVGARVYDLGLRSLERRGFARLRGSRNWVRSPLSDGEWHRPASADATASRRAVPHRDHRHRRSRTCAIASCSSSCRGCAPTSSDEVVDWEVSGGDPIDFIRRRTTSTCGRTLAGPRRPHRVWWRCSPVVAVPRSASPATTSRCAAASCSAPSAARPSTACRRSTSRVRWSRDCSAMAQRRGRRRGRAPNVSSSTCPPTNAEAGARRHPAPRVEASSNGGREARRAKPPGAARGGGGSQTLSQTVRPRDHRSRNRRPGSAGRPSSSPSCTSRSAGS